MDSSTEGTLYTPEDQSIVESAGELCQQLNVTRFKPKTISWVTIRPRRTGNRVDASNSCGFDRTRVFMSSALRGKLEADEWKPMIAPSLIFHSSPRIRLKYYVAILVFAPYIVGTLTLGTFIGVRALYLQRGTLAAAIFGVVFLSLSFLFFLFSANYTALYTKKLWLLADRQATQLLGSRSLLRVLQKIDSMKLDDVEEVKKMRTFSTWSIRSKPWGRPTITERIEHLLEEGI